MTVLFNILLFIIILTIIISIHEFGHFIWAKLTGVYVYEFAIGMGPKIISKQYGETVYSIRAIPFGGFCSLAGEDLDEDDAKKVPKNKRLQNKSCWQRFLIMVFGPLNNFILAVVLLFFIALIWGGTTMKPIISEVEKGSAVEKIGIEEGDKIVKINGKKVTTSDDVSLYIAMADPTKKNTITVERDGKNINFKVKPEKIGKGKEVTYKYGMALKQERTKGFGNAIVYTFKKTGSIFKQMFITVGALFTGGVKVSQLSGPVGIYSVVGEQAKTGLANIIYLVAFLSINVGFINLLPFPAFDGGRIFLLLIEKIRKKPLKAETENLINTVGFILIMILAIYVTGNDIFKLIFK